jgi:hypothetical protein
MLRMLRRLARWLAACLAALAGWPTAAPAEAASTIEVSLDARATLYYYLECATGGISCSQHDVAILLGGILGQDLAARLESEWGGTLEKYTIEAQLRAPASPDLPGAGPDTTETLDLRARIDDVLFAGGPADLVRAKLGVILGAAEVRALEAAFAAAWPIFARWWSDHEGDWRSYAARVEDLVHSDAARVVQASGRMHGQSDDTNLTVHLIAVPVAGPVNRASQKGSRSFVEFRPGDDPVSRVAVMVHEYCHYLFETAPRELRRARWDAFAASPDPAAASALAVMNEALASAIGNGLFMKAHLDAPRFDDYASRRESYYANAAVDRAAKAALPLVEQYAHSGRAMDRAFFDEYFRRSQVTFADNPADPRVALGVSQFYYTQDSLERLAVGATSRYGFTSVYFNRWSPDRYPETMAYRFPALPVAIIGTDADYRPALANFLPDADLPLVGGLRAAACKARREGGGWLYVFVVSPSQLLLDMPSRLPDCGRKLV